METTATPETGPIALGTFSREELGMLVLSLRSAAEQELSNANHVVDLASHYRKLLPEELQVFAPMGVLLAKLRDQHTELYQKYSRLADRIREEGVVVEQVGTDTIPKHEPVRLTDRALRVVRKALHSQSVTQGLNDRRLEAEELYAIAGRFDHAGEVRLYPAAPTRPPTQSEISAARSEARTSSAPAAANSSTPSDGVAENTLAVEACPACQRPTHGGYPEVQPVAETEAPAPLASIGQGSHRLDITG